ncbi:MAG: CGNR zinc finger domain-containing protein [Pseudomonadota bacterium]
MTYSLGHPVNLVASRLALDFVNTADWSSDGIVVHEKLANKADLSCWLDAVALPQAGQPSSLEGLWKFRNELRDVFVGERRANLASLQAELETIAVTGQRSIGKQPILGLIAASALSILSDPRELDRVKMCPGDDCGWLFVDETKNRRRRWCRMETCGNRAKAARHYKRTKQDNR